MDTYTPIDDNAPLKAYVRPWLSDWVPPSIPLTNTLRWGRRIGGLEPSGMHWLVDGYLNDQLRCRVYAADTVFGMELMRTPRGRPRQMYLACTESSARGTGFELLSTHGTRAAAFKACARHLGCV